MSEMGGDNDEIECGSDYPYAEDIGKAKQSNVRIAQVTSTNTSSHAPRMKGDSKYGDIEMAPV